MLDVINNLNQIKVEANKINNLLPKLIAATENNNERNEIESELHNAFISAISESKEALKGIRMRQRGNALVLISRQKQLNYIGLISCAFSLFSFIVFTCHVSRHRGQKNVKTSWTV
jgi:hypothetical protein